MIQKNRVKPIPHSADTSGTICNVSSLANDIRETSKSSSKEVNDLDSLSTVGIEDSSYLKLKPFSKLDPTIVRLLKFLSCFGLTVNIDQSWKHDKQNNSFVSGSGPFTRYSRLFFILLTGVLSAEVVYDVNLRQSKLLAEQKRSTPLLTFVIVAYSWLTLVIPLICNMSLILMGSNLFRFYSRTTATVCNG